MYPMIDRYIEKIIKESTPDRPLWNIESIRQGKKPQWNYIDGCMMTSLIELYHTTEDQRLINFVKEHIDYYVASDGSMLGYDMAHFSTDDICESRVLFDLYDLTKDPKYQLAIEKTYEHIQKQPRTKEGNFWHKKIYPNQVWLDGLFMALPFYTRYVTSRGLLHLYKDIIDQFRVVRQRMFNPEKKLYYHGYDASKSIFWADPVTGLSKNFWLRAMGWYVVALVDVFAYMKDETIRQDQLKPLLKEMIDGLLLYQDPSTHMFYQVVDQANKPGNYVETSGSALIAYAMLKGVRLGMLDASYMPKGQQIFDGIVSKYLTEKNGDLNLSGICLVAGLGPENNTRRDGTFEYYMSEPIVENDAKGVAPFLMAYTELIQTKK